MHQRKRLSIKSATITGIAASALLGLAGLTLNPAPANAIVYCQYVSYPAGCVARAGVVLRPRPVARAAVRHNAGGNMNGGVNRVGARRESTCLRVTRSYAAKRLRGIIGRARTFRKSLRPDGATGSRVRGPVAQSANAGEASPDCAEPFIGRRCAPARWLHAGQA